jgi:peptidoglycan/xylan/chitin deacetylase (PgdA/CDA1 family)
MGIFNSVKKQVLLVGGPLINKYYSGIGHILMFHSVVPASKQVRISNDSLEVTPEHLEKVILFFLNKGYKIISLDQFYDRINEKKKQEKFVVFTFDDGYLDNLQYAYPVFKKFNIPFTLYVTTNFPDKKAIIWWYPLEEILRRNDKIQFSFKAQSYEFITSRLTEKLAAFNLIRSLIQNCPENDVEGLVDAILLPYGLDVREISNKLSLTWEDLRLLADDPLVTIGAHTVNHFRLNTLTEEGVKRELLESKMKLELNLGRTIDHFSYPFGSRKDVGPREFRIAQEVGFKTATTTRFGTIFNLHQEHLHSLPRINIDLDVNEKELLQITNGEMHLIGNRGKRIISN